MPRFPLGSAPARTLSDRVYGSLAARAAARGGSVFALNVGDTYREPIEAARAERQRTSDHPRLHNYAPVQGEPGLRRAFVERLRARRRVELDADELQVMSGATAGFAVVANAILDPGDEVVVLAPFWPLIRGIVALRGATPVQLPFYTRLGEAGFDPEAAIEAAVTDRTVAIYVNSPNNPTGVVVDDAVAAAIARVAARHDLWVLADEAYEELVYEGAAFAPVWARPDLVERAIVCHTLSKSHGLAGSRIGFTHGPSAIMEAIRGAQTFLTYCAPRPLQLGAEHALREGDGWIAESRALYQAAASACAASLGVPAPLAGTFLFFDCARFLAPSDPTSTPFLERCAEEGVLLTPGGASGDAYARWARLCFTAVAPDELDRALAALRRVVAARPG